MKPIEVVIGENAKRYREKMGWSITQFSKLIIKPKAYIQKLENGEHNITIKALEDVAIILGVTVLDMVEDWSDMD